MSKSCILVISLILDIPVWKRLAQNLTFKSFHDINYSCIKESLRPKIVHFNNFINIKYSCIKEIFRPKCCILIISLILNIPVIKEILHQNISPALKKYSKGNYNMKCMDNFSSINADTNCIRSNSKKRITVDISFQF